MYVIIIIALIVIVFIWAKCKAISDARAEEKRKEMEIAQRNKKREDEQAAREQKIKLLEEAIEKLETEKEHLQALYLELTKKNDEKYNSEIDETKMKIDNLNKEIKALGTEKYEDERRERFRKELENTLERNRNISVSPIVHEVEKPKKEEVKIPWFLVGTMMSKAHYAELEKRKAERELKSTNEYERRRAEKKLASYQNKTGKQLQDILNKLNK